MSLKSSPSIEKTFSASKAYYYGCQMGVCLKWWVYVGILYMQPWFSCDMDTLKTESENDISNM